MGSDRTILAEQVLRGATRARTFSVVRVLQTEPLSPANDTSRPSNSDKEKPNFAIGGGATTASENLPEKVIGINLPKKHASTILEAIKKLEGGNVS